MNKAGILVDLSIWSNKITSLLAIANLIVVIVIVGAAIVQYKELEVNVTNSEKWGSANWKRPLLIILALSLASIFVYFSPYLWSGGFGSKTFSIPIFLYAVEIFFCVVYEKMLADHIWKSGYWYMVAASKWLDIVTFISSILFAAATYATTNF